MLTAMVTCGASVVHAPASPDELWRRSSSGTTSSCWQ